MSPHNQWGELHLLFPIKHIQSLCRLLEWLHVCRRGLKIKMLFHLHKSCTTFCLTVVRMTLFVYVCLSTISTVNIWSGLLGYKYLVKVRKWWWWKFREPMWPLNRKQDANRNFKCQIFLTGRPPLASDLLRILDLLHYNNVTPLAKWQEINVRKYNYFLLCLIPTVPTSCVVCNYLLHAPLGSSLCLNGVLISSAFVWMVSLAIASWAWSAGFI